MYDRALVVSEELCSLIVLFPRLTVVQRLLRVVRRLLRVVRWLLHVLRLHEAVALTT